MIPLRDNVPSRTTPVVNYLLILINCLIFLAQASDSDGRLTFQFGMIPARISQPDRPVVIEQTRMVRTMFGVQEVQTRLQVPPSPMSPWLTAVTCILLHGSLAHLVGNMWFLWIFGDNVEDRLGHLGYLLFYVTCGILASLSHYATDPSSTVPTIGASGAIAGVMGAYLFLYPHANVISLVPILFFLQVMVIPAPLFLGLWFVLQLLQGSFSMGAAEVAGVAWWAHIGGFVVGFVLAWLLGRVGRTRPRVSVIRPDTAQRFGRMRSPWE